MIYASLIKWIIIGAAICGAFWFIHSALEWKADAERGTENYRQSRLVDSLKVANYILTKEQIQETVETDPRLAKIVADNDINLKRIETIVMQSLLYRDNTSRSSDASQLLAAIGKRERYTFPWKDSTACMKIGGKMVYIPTTDGRDTLLINVDRREFSNEYTAIGYLKRRQWKFLGIKTRFLGKLEATATVTNTCGESKTINIQKNKD